MVLHQLEEEDVILDRELVAVSLRVELGQYLKIDSTNIDDRGTVKSISFDGNVQLMADSGVCTVRRNII